MRVLIESDKTDFNLALIEFLNNYENSDCEGILVTVLEDFDMMPGFNMIFNDGIRAHNSGKVRENCPYMFSVNPQEFTVWQRGYNRAAEVQKEVDSRPS